MIRIAKILASNKITLQKKTFEAILTNRNTIQKHPLQGLVNYRNIFQFSRKKPTKMRQKLNQSLDKAYQQLKSSQKKKQNQFPSLKKLKQKYNLPLPILLFFSIFLGSIIFKLYYIITQKKQKLQIHDKIIQKMNKNTERTNFNVQLEIKLREWILMGHVMNYQLQIVRRNRRLTDKYYNICFFKTPNNKSFAVEINNIADFLHFVENQPIDYKVTFQYENYDDSSTQKSPITFIFKMALLTAGLIIGRKSLQSLKGLFKGGQSQNMFDMDKKKIQAIKPQNINTLFKDVAGMHEAKFQITEFVDFLKSPQKYIQMGAKVPKGALLTGPPGTGKTLLARACAGQAGVPFYYVSGSDFVQKYVGLGASRVRKLFDQAQKNAPSIIFIDQIDAIGKKRDSGPFANQERDNTLNQLLVRMDGFDTKNKVIVMAATNIKDSLDPALLRPGRFDRSVQIGLPNFEERKQILQVHLKKVKFDPQFTIQELANRVSILTPGFSGAELANVCNQAAILAARQGLDLIDIKKFEKATERVMAGLQKRNLFSDEEKLMLAYYESGKAVVGWFTQGSDPIIKLSILPFSKAKQGYSHTIKDQIGLTTKQELLGKVCFYLAGRASEDYFQKFVTTNGDSDLKRAKRIITLLVTKFGMSQKLKNIAFPDTEFVRKPYSSQIQNMIDQQINRFTNQCKIKVENLIIEKADLIQKLKTKLLLQQSLSHADIKEILGDRPFQSNENYQKYLVEQQKSHTKKQEPGSEILTPIQKDDSQLPKQKKQDMNKTQFKRVDYL